MILVLRPKQWIKNLFIFFPVFFGGKLTSANAAVETLIAFAGFCFLTSAVYILNDLSDVNEDRLHPQKKFRPIASGKLSFPLAVAEMIVALFIGFGIFFCLEKTYDAIVWSTAYLLLNIAYTFKLKQISIIDTVTIACGFVIRLYLGSAVSSIALSNWIIIMVFIAALLLAIGKRRDDLVNYHENRHISRRNIQLYSIEYLNVILSVLAAVLVVIYIQYVLSAEAPAQTNGYLFLTIPFVLTGLLRYLQIVLVEKKEADPSAIIWKDTFLQLVLIGWLFLFGYLLYF